MHPAKKCSSKPYYMQIYEHFSSDIERGIYTAGTKLPSIRECASMFAVSATTVRYGYQKLFEEGYVDPKQGSGFIVTNQASVNLHDCYTNHTPNYQEALKKLKLDSEADDKGGHTSDTSDIKHHLKQPEADARIRYDFSLDKVDETLMPLKTWANISRDVVLTDSETKSYLNSDSQGFLELRQQICHFIASEHGLICEPEQILLAPSMRSIIDSIVGLFPMDGSHFSMGNPSFKEPRELLSKYKRPISTIQTYPYPEWETIERALARTRVVLTAPSNQFPTNHIMPIGIRRKLVSWADNNDAFILDDEFFWDLQSGEHRLPLLAHIDSSGHVITMSSFAGLFGPNMCISYAILPPGLMIRWRETSKESHSQIPWQIQAAMATFMAKGHWHAHVRRMRKHMHRKYQIIMSAIENHMGNSVEALSSPNSTFVLIKTCDERSEEQLIKQARHAGIRVYPTSRFWNDTAPFNWNYVLVSFSGIAEDDIEPGIHALAKAWYLSSE